MYSGTLDMSARSSLLVGGAISSVGKRLMGDGKEILLPVSGSPFVEFFWVTLGI